MREFTNTMNNLGVCGKVMEGAVEAGDAPVPVSGGTTTGPAPETRLRSGLMGQSRRVHKSLKRSGPAQGCDFWSWVMAALTLLAAVFLALLLMAAFTGCQTTREPEAVKPAPVHVEEEDDREVITVAETIVVTGTFDGKGRVYRADAKRLGDGSQAEGQKPVFLLRGNATLKNLTIAAPAADGIHVETQAGKKNYVLGCIWRDVGEDAITVTGNGEARIAGCEFYHAADKALQLNGPAKTYVEDCHAENFGRFARGCGTCKAQPYWIEIKRLTAKNGDTILKLSNKEARGRIVGGKFTNIKDIAQATNGAKIDFVK